MAYQLEGSLLEVCTCKVICPCWVGEDPDGGQCDGIVAYHVDRGTVDGVDVSGHSFVLLAHIPGNVLKGNWRAVVYVDDKATPQQEEALISAFTGKLGGPLADLAQLVGEVVAVERAPIDFRVEKGKGTLKIGDGIEAELEPLQGATGFTTLNDSIFSNIPGSPAYVSKAPKYRANVPQLGFNISLSGHNAVQGSFRFVG
ncbi:MAG: DUF1326 domain-containing protein [Dehalococcoidia bacterium]|nr:DUF1326 domain-containing protein [Dehalococcoidia bacterium]